jgi:hypothetical protein
MGDPSGSAMKAGSLMSDFTGLGRASKVRMSHPRKIGMSHSLSALRVGVWHGLGGDGRTRASPR